MPGRETTTLHPLFLSALRDLCASWERCVDISHVPMMTAVAQGVVQPVALLGGVTPVCHTPPHPARLRYLMAACHSGRAVPRTAIKGVAGGGVFRGGCQYCLCWELFCRFAWGPWRMWNPNPGVPGGVPPPQVQICPPGAPGYPGSSTPAGPHPGYPPVIPGAPGAYPATAPGGYPCGPPQPGPYPLGQYPHGHPPPGHHPHGHPYPGPPGMPGCPLRPPDCHQKHHKKHKKKHSKHHGGKHSSSSSSSSDSD